MPSQFSSLALLALASAAVAHPFKPSGYKPTGGYAHPTGTGAPYNLGNGTGPYGTGYATGTDTILYSTTSITETRVNTVVVTVYPTGSSAVVAEAVGTGVAVAGTEICSERETSTTTFTNRVTVTVQPIARAAESAAASESKVCTKKIKSSSAVTTPAASATPSSSSEELAVSSFSLLSSFKGEAVASPTSSSSSSAVAVSVSAAAYGSVSSSSTAAASSSTSSSYTDSGAKRGLAYNDAALCDTFVGNSKVSWAYNWGQSSTGLSSSFEYVPLLWSTTSTFTTNWFSNAKSAIAAGSTHLLGFNEPDYSGQANLSPAVAAAGWLTYLEPFKTSNPDVRLGSPAVTNGADGMGLDWLSSFITACSTCTIDFVAIHWYDSATNIDYFKAHVEEAYTSTGKPVWVTEFGATGTDAEISTFLTEVMAWMDSQDYVERYSYFMVASGSLVNGDALSTIGSTYASTS